MRTFVFVVVASFLAGWASAAKDWQGFFKNVLKSLTSDTAQRYASSGMRLTAVAAVRGAPLGQQDPAEPYWKGGISQAAAKTLAKEREEFAAAVQLILDGKAPEGSSALEKFQKEHPKSALMPDVKEALAQLPREALRAAQAPAAAEEEVCSKDAPKEGAAGCAPQAAAPDPPQAQDKPSEEKKAD